jgi:hypothetical protein
LESNALIVFHSCVHHGRSRHSGEGQRHQEYREPQDPELPTLRMARVELEMLGSWAA